jgi:hypothetical protein
MRVRRRIWLPTFFFPRLFLKPLSSKTMDSIFH